MCVWECVRVIFFGGGGRRKEENEPKKTKSMRHEGGSPLLCLVKFTVTITPQGDGQKTPGGEGGGGQ